MHINECLGRGINQKRENGSNIIVKLIVSLKVQAMGHASISKINS